MTKDKFDKLTKEIWEKVINTRKQGQNEYARSAGDVLANFKRIANWQGTNQENILMTYLLKHIDGINAWIKGHKSQREDVRGRIKDAIVYLCLLWGMAETEIVSEEEIETFLSDNGFVNNKRGGTHPMEFNPDTGEVSYQAIGDEII